MQAWKAAWRLLDETSWKALLVEAWDLFVLGFSSSVLWQAFLWQLLWFSFRVSLSTFGVSYFWLAKLLLEQIRLE